MMPVASAMGTRPLPTLQVSAQFEFRNGLLSRNDNFTPGQRHTPHLIFIDVSNFYFEGLVSIARGDP